MCRQAHIIRRSRHHWRSQHHLPKANIIQKRNFCLVDKSSFFVGGGWWIRDHILSSRSLRSEARTANGKEMGRISWFLHRWPHHHTSHQAKNHCFRSGFCLVGDGGFGPPKSVTTDLQSAPFGRSGNPPYGAGERSRTINRLITNQVLCH